MERVHALIDRTHRALVDSRRAGQLRSRMLRADTPTVRCARTVVRSVGMHWLRLHYTRFKRAPVSNHGEGTHTRTVTECVKSRLRASRLSRANSESVGERLRTERGATSGTRAAPHRPLPPMNDNNGRRSTRPQTE